MDTYIITAKTVEEAISSAKKQYEDENHEVSYEILEMPKKGFLGLGAKDAKVKITVSKTEKVELGSLVAEMRSMKNLTDRTGSGSGDTEKTSKKPEQKQPREPKPQQNQQPKPQNQQPKQPKPADGQNPQNPPRQQKQGEGKPAQNPQNKPAQPKPQGEKQGQPKQQNPQNQQPKQPKEPKAADGQNQPKEPKEPKEPKLPKQQNPQNQQPKEPKPADQPKAEAAAEKIGQTAAGAAAETSRLDQAIANATTVTTKFGDAGAEYKSSLHNSSRPNRRAPQKHGSNPDEKIDASAVTVSQPMGLTDFVADPNAQGFGKGSGSGNSAGKMNNDVRKKKKNAPKTAGDKKPESTVARYDFAESDDDYEKLNRLVSEAESELEAAEAAVLVPKMPTEPEEEDAEELAPARETRRREAITQAEMDYALEFANTLLANMKLEARAVPAECPEGEEFDTTEEATVYPKIDIVGDDTGILIGHHGETLDSIQYLTNLSALRKTKSRDGDYVKIVVDIENYREKREDTLRTLARRMAARAVKYKRNVFLEPMNAYERRIIHSELQSFENVSTHSVGADRDRKIIITYEGPDKQPDNRQNNGGRRRRGDKAPAEESGANANANANADNGAARENGGNGNGGRSRRRPRKSQKMPIEKLDELLPGGEETAAVTEAAEAIETAVETAVEAAVVDAPAQPDEE